MQDLQIAVEKMNCCLGSKKTMADTIQQDEIESLGMFFTTFFQFEKFLFPIPKHYFFLDRLKRNWFELGNRFNHELLILHNVICRLQSKILSVAAHKNE